MFDCDGESIKLLLTSLIEDNINDFHCNANKIINQFLTLNDDSKSINVLLTSLIEYNGIMKKYFVIF